MTVEDAVDYALLHAPITAGVTMEQLAGDYRKHRRDQVEIGERYAETLDSYLKRICKTFGKDLIAAVTKARVQKFLDRLKGRDKKTPASTDTKNHYLETFIALFNYAKAERLLVHSPIEQLKKQRGDDEDIIVLTLDQTSKLLAALQLPQHADVAPAALLQLFAAPRRSELMHITWNVVSEKYLRLDKVKRGTKKRPVEMPAALLEWIKPLRKSTGYVFDPPDLKINRDCASISNKEARKKAVANALKQLEDAYTWRLEKAAKSAGIIIAKNALRHTGITMRVNFTDNIAATARWSGNSPRVIEENYLGAGTQDDAKLFYELRPASRKTCSDLPQEPAPTAIPGTQIPGRAV
jgi:site-specific recombinase XerD